MRRIMSGPGRMRRVQILFLFLLVIFTTLALYLNYKNQGASEQFIISQTQNRQLILARAGASSMEWFFKTLESEVSAMSKISSIQSQDVPQTRSIFIDFIQKYKLQPYLVITLMDENAKILIAENNAGIKSAEGQSFPDRDYFIKAKDPVNRGKVQVSDPFISRAGLTEGKPVIAITTPLYSGNQFKGLILLISELNGFTGEFVQPLRVSGVSQALIIDNQDTIVGTDVDSGLIGRRIEDIAVSLGITNTKEYQSIYRTARSVQEGIGEWNEKYKDKSDINNLIAYRKFNVGDKQWLLIVSTPKEVALSEQMSLLSFSLVSVILIVTCSFLAGVIFIITGNSAQLHGFKKALRLLYSS